MSATEQEIDDTMPEAPLVSQPGATAEPINGLVDASMFDGVSKMGEVMPAGTFHFRLQGAFEGWSEPAKDPTTGLAKDAAVAAFGKQPWFNLDWRCQQEPHTGRRCTEMVFWCTQEVFEKAAAGEPTARKMVKQRLVGVNDILAACSYKPVGQFDLKAFFASNPECKIQVGLTKRKAKDATGKYVPTDEDDNKVIKHVSLTRPA